MKTMYWKRTNKNGSLAEGKYTLARRIFGRIFLGERYQVIGVWHE